MRRNLQWRLTMSLCLTLFFLRTPSEKTITRTPNPPGAFQLDILDDGKQLKLLVRHREIGPVCELWCYEGGPFHYGKGLRRDDGSIVFIHTSGKMTATTTFTARGSKAISMDILVNGPLDELKKVNIVGPCMQFWHSDSFKRENNLLDFAQRCFLYTIRGPVGMMDTGRGLMKDFAPDAAENRPPWTQWYVPIEARHPGDIWAFGASGDRPLYGLVGVSSRDGHWLSAMGCARAWTLGQGWHDCIHLVPQMQSYLNQQSGTVSHRSILYVMANDKQDLFETYRRDFPDSDEDTVIQISEGKIGRLNITPRRQNGPGVDLLVKLAGPDQPGTPREGSDWKVSPWGGFVRGSAPWRMWAFPHGDVVDLWVSLDRGIGLDRVEAILDGKGWNPAAAPNDVPALVRRSADGLWVTALMWERQNIHNPAVGLPLQAADKGRVLSLRGRVYLFNGEEKLVRERWLKSKEEWEHSRPYFMPLEKP